MSFVRVEPLSLSEENTGEDKNERRREGGKSVLEDKEGGEWASIPSEDVRSSDEAVGEAGGVSTGIGDKNMGDVGDKSTGEELSVKGCWSFSFSGDVESQMGTSPGALLERRCTERIPKR